MESCNVTLLTPCVDVIITPLPWLVALPSACPWLQTSVQRESTLDREDTHHALCAELAPSTRMMALPASSTTRVRRVRTVMQVVCHPTVHSFCFFFIASTAPLPMFDADHAHTLPAHIQGNTPTAPERAAVIAQVCHNRKNLTPACPLARSPTSFRVTAHVLIRSVWLC